MPGPPTETSTPAPEPAAGIVVAIDGPAGAGKSTAARLLAGKLGYDLLDTGAIYRTLALLASRQGVSWESGPGVAALAAGLSIRFRLAGDVNHVLVDDRDVTGEIRTPHISDGASRVSALPEVRAALLDLQRRLGARGGVVAEGRDVGTVVFPQAAAKFFLVATPEERARRRTAELRAAGHAADEQAVLAEILARDSRDSGRAVAPLRKADDAVEIDTSRLGPVEVVEHMFGLVQAIAKIRAAAGA